MRGLAEHVVVEEATNDVRHKPVAADRPSTIRRLSAELDLDTLVRRLEEANPELVAPNCPVLKKCGTYG